ncbi:hypothetical protein [Cellulomonas sp. NPDC058312]|uniref:hypothetical protein n=1 Tax=Cellulomonas sp. NPDC058312 TaxID=3346441 RepID=UPI0036EE7CC1
MTGTAAVGRRQLRTRSAPDHSAASAVARYLPPAAAVTAVVLVLHRYGTPVPVSLMYLAYLALAVALPGTVIWRAVRGRTVSFVEDVALGTAIGLAIQVLLAFALAPLHLTRWSWLWSVAVLMGSLLSRRWRAAAWTRPGAPTTTPASAWVQALVVVGATVWLAGTALASNPVAYADGSGPWSRGVPGSVYVDLPFHQAIAAGVDTHYPLVYPYLLDEPLRYHLFVYEHLAGAAHVSGVDLTWLLYRLMPVALVSLGVVLTGVLTRRLSGSAWSAPAAAAVVTLSSAANVYGWTAFGFQNPGFLHFATYRSPTQTFGIALFLAMLTVAVALLRDGRFRGRIPLLGVFTLLAWGAGGSKSTFLPVAVAALALVVVVAAVLRTGVVRLSAALLGICAAGFALLLVVVLGGQSGSLTVTPFGTTRAFAAAQAVADPTSARDVALVVALTLAAWLCSSAGLLLLLRREILRDAAFWLLLGTAGAGIGACLLTTANGLSQLYFLYAAWPALGVLSVWGLVVAMRDWPRRVRALVPGALLAGAMLLWAVRRIDGLERPAPASDPGFPYVAMATPWLMLASGAALLAIVGAVGAHVVQRRHGLGVANLVRPGAAGLVVLSLVLTGGSLLQRSGEVVRAAVSVVRDGQGPGESYPIPHDGALAALVVRDSSGTSDVIATNAHCYGPPDACDTRHFWVSALTERRVLVEGWAYPEGFRPGQTRTSPFWDTERYEANEAVFDDPDEASVQLLADRWGVRWLLVDRSVGTESPELRRFATLVHESDGAAVYRID